MTNSSGEAPKKTTPDRAILFVDGSNWYHALKDCGVTATMALNYARISERLLGPRRWIETRYYGVNLDQATAPGMYADNRRFLSQIRADDPRVRTYLGRLEPRPTKNPMADEVREFVRQQRDSLTDRQEAALDVLVRRYSSLVHYTEKGVDVRLAVDMYRLAHEDAYDAAYLLSADGDFAPAVEMVTALGKTVYAACPNFGSALEKVCQTFIKLDKHWFRDCYR